jgi:hypothetical protein
MLAFPGIECSVSEFVHPSIVKQRRNGAITCCAQNKLGKGHLLDAMLQEMCAQCIYRAVVTELHHGMSNHVRSCIHIVPISVIKLIKFQILQ